MVKRGTQGKGLLLALLLLLLASCDPAQRDELAVLNTDMGEMVIAFHYDEAPVHVARIKELARQGFYDGLLFHRVIPGFVIQTGDPGTRDPATPRSEYGKGGSGLSLEAEFSDLQHRRGTVSMARTARGPNTASSQFFICLAPQPHLDSTYTVVGELLRGMEVADSIATVEVDMRDAPRVPVRLRSMKIVKDEELGIDL